MIKILNKITVLKNLKKMIKIYFRKIQYMIFMIGNIRKAINEFHNHIMICKITKRLSLYYKIKESNVLNIIHH